MAKTLNGALHAHGCRSCRTRYTDACTQNTTDDLCTGCRGGRVWQVMVDSAAPHDCCRTGARIVTKDEMSTYRLAGTALWFICTRCSRTHPFNPRRTP